MQRAADKQKAREADQQSVLDGEDLEDAAGDLARGSGGDGESAENVSSAVSTTSSPAAAAVH